MVCYQYHTLVAILKEDLAEASDISLSSGDLICHLSPTGAYKYQNSGG